MGKLFNGRGGEVVDHLHMKRSKNQFPAGYLFYVTMFKCRNRQ